MANKTYNQYCSVAHALDVVGERWSLLVIRNLLAGPKRFSDLMKGLPGISTNILTDRLKLLEENDVITTRYLPPPAASTVYALTPSGYALAPTLAALARWGAQTIGEPAPTQAVVPEAVFFMIHGVFWGRASATPTTLNFHITGEDLSYGVHLSPQEVVITEEIFDTPQATLHIGLHALLLLSSGQQDFQTLLQNGMILVEGSLPPIF